MRNRNVKAKQAAEQGSDQKDRFCEAPEASRPIQAVRNWKDGDINVGDAVFYRGTRYWVEYVPPSFEQSAHVRISDTRIDPTPGRLPHNKRCSFSVPADLVTLAPVRQIGLKQPTIKDIERAERAKAGAKDVGDRVADLLRDKNLDEAYEVASRFLRVPPEDLRAKYGHLNNGQQRMNLGNRMRSWEKKHG